MCKLTLTAGLCVIIAILGLPGPGVLAGNICYGRADGDYYNPYDQHSFITCAHGIAYVKQCPANLVYDTSIRVCNYPTQTYTGNFCNGKADGDYPHYYDLYSFITCAHGIDHIIECPSNLVYNPSIGVCDYPSNGNFCYRRRDGNYYNRDNPNSFISCSGGITYILACPADLVYRRYSDSCEYPIKYYT